MCMLLGEHMNAGLDWGYDQSGAAKMQHKSALQAKTCIVHGRRSLVLIQTPSHPQFTR